MKIVTDSSLGHLKKNKVAYLLLDDVMISFIGAVILMAKPSF